MLTAEQNRLLTETEPGTPGGELLRRYWQPAALSEELAAGGAPLPVRLLGEDLVLFRDEDGLPGLLGRHCVHRGTDLSYGRVENGGLRCVYHGWLYDRAGRCLEQPGEPARSDFCDKGRQKSYPCLERGGIIFAYLGPGAPPLLPNYEPLGVAENQRFATKYFQACNYLQGNEGNIDPVHVSYLHRQLRPKITENGSDYRREHAQLLSEDVCPHLETEQTAFGLRIYAVRQVDSGTYVRITNFVMPNLSAFGGATAEHGYAMHWHVPIDDVTHFKYLLVFSRDQPLDVDRLRRERSEDLQEGYRLRRNRSNRYLQDRDEMRTGTFTGMGLSFINHDAFATESQGAVQDRTLERLGTSDVAIIAARKMLLEAVQTVAAGQDPRHVIRRPEDNDLSDIRVVRAVLPAGSDWQSGWRECASTGALPLQHLVGPH